MNSKEKIFLRAGSSMLLALIFMGVGLGASGIYTAKHTARKTPIGISPSDILYPEKSKIKIQVLGVSSKHNLTATIDYPTLDLSDEPIYVREEYGIVVAQG